MFKSLNLHFLLCYFCRRWVSGKVLSSVGGLLRGIPRVGTKRKRKRKRKRGTMVEINYRSQTLAANPEKQLWVSTNQERNEADWVKRSTLKPEAHRDSRCVWLLKLCCSLNGAQLHELSVSLLHEHQEHRGSFLPPERHVLLSETGMSSYVGSNRNWKPDQTQLVHTWLFDVLRMETPGQRPGDCWDCGRTCSKPGLTNRNYKNFLITNSSFIEHQHPWTFYSCVQSVICITETLREPRSHAIDGTYHWGLSCVKQLQPNKTTYFKSHRTAEFGPIMFLASQSVNCIKQYKAATSKLFDWIIETIPTCLCIYFTGSHAASKTNFKFSLNTPSGFSPVDLVPPVVTGSNCSCVLIILVLKFF